MDKKTKLLLDGLTIITLSEKMWEDEMIDELLGGTEELGRRLWTTQKIESFLRCQKLREEAQLTDGRMNIFYYLCKVNKDISSHSARFVESVKYFV